ncbi:TolC family protein [Sphingobacterium sp. DN04309]|uniref:TolC family protein n=1 Tax=Sphingobacterium litopenaei TaxID=2763500 RepID=A0ABR7YHV3_9SPHI|nr:TolC family protein [Sphingobacterium litopenaei]
MIILCRFAIIFLLIFSVKFRLKGQSVQGLKLSYTEFIAAVKSYHPLVVNYKIENQIAEADLQRARGGFDPVLEGKMGSKTIDGVNYYNERNASLGIPVWYGVEIRGKYSYIDGDKLNNSETPGELYQVGVTLPLLQNLLYDKRRAILDQAKEGLNMAKAEQIIRINEVLLEADNTYWNWVKEYELLKLQSEVVEVNRKRVSLTLKTLEYGERAAIDTTEAISQLQSFQLDEQDAYLRFLKATQELTLFLWKENNQPYDILDGLIPERPLSSIDVYKEYPVLIRNVREKSTFDHGSLRYYLGKQNYLISEKALKFQSLLPKVNFTYNYLNKQNRRSEVFPMFEDNFQYGLKLELPIFLRQAKGDYKIAKHKLYQNSLEIQYKAKEIENKVTNYINNLTNYHSQIRIAERNIENYQKLLQAEELRFANGESSLFVINSRENKLIDAQSKILDLRLKFMHSYNELKWLNNSFIAE